MISATAPGKVNLFFQVGHVLPNGYHNVLSLYQAVDLLEKVSTEPATKWSIEVHGLGVDTSLVPADQSNLVMKAAIELANHVGIENPQPMRFLIEKQIPVAGGMAGGSADAAATLIALNEAWCLGLDKTQLLLVASRVGADVPFALLGGTAVGRSTGVDLNSVQVDFDRHIVLILNPQPLSTKAVFEKFDELGMGEELPESDDLPNLLGQIGYNSLEPAAFDLLPSLRSLAAEDFGISPAHLSGSGPTLWCYTESASAAQLAAEKARSLGYKSLVTKTSSRGGELI